MRGLSWRWWFWYWIILVAISAGFLISLLLLPPETTTSAPPTRHVVHAWVKADSLAYAHDQVIANAEAQFICLSNLWAKESAWEPRAHNPVRIMGKTAGGIPQLLGMSPLTPPTLQIERGLSYIYFRYGTACGAWKQWRREGWY